MATTLFNGVNFGSDDYWSSSSNKIYNYLSYDSISRSGNTVTVSGIKYWFETAQTSYALGYTYNFSVRVECGGDSSSGTITIPPSGSWTQQGPINLANLVFTVGTSTTSATVTLTNENGSDTETINFPSGATSPTGLHIDSVIPSTDSFTITGGVTSMGSGGTSNRIKLLVCSQPYTVGGLPTRGENFYDSLTATKTITNSSEATGGSLTITANSTYYAGVYATNGVLDNRYNYGAVYTLPLAPTLSAGTVTDTTATLAYSTLADGGALAKTIEYSLDNGTTWNTGATVSTGSASSGSFMITGLTAGTSYTILTRATTTAGSTAGTTVYVTTTGGQSSAKLYGSVNNQTKEIKKLYGSVNGQTKLITKLYGSVNGQTKLIYEG